MKYFAVSCLINLAYFLPIANIVFIIFICIGKVERRFCLFFYSLKTPRVVSSAQNISQVSHSHTICNYQPPTLQSQSYSGLSVIKSGFLPWSSIKDKNWLIYVNIWVGRSLFITIQAGGEIRTKFHICCYAHRVASVLVKDLLWSPICHKDTANSFFFMSSLPQSRPHPVVDQSDFPQ